MSCEPLMIWVILIKGLHAIADARLCVYEVHMNPYFAATLPEPPWCHPLHHDLIRQRPAFSRGFLLLFSVVVFHCWRDRQQLQTYMHECCANLPSSRQPLSDSDRVYARMQASHML